MLCRVMRVHPWWLSRVHLYYNDETLRTGGKNLECGDLSPLLPLWRLVAKAGPRPAARESWTPSRIRRRQVACGKRGRVRALQSDCGFAALCPSVVSTARSGMNAARPFVLVNMAMTADGKITTA